MFQKSGTRSCGTLGVVSEGLCPHSDPNDANDAEDAERWISRVCALRVCDDTFTALLHCLVSDAIACSRVVKARPDSAHQRLITFAILPLVTTQEACTAGKIT